jgi:hypothetical protein
LKNTNHTVISIYSGIAWQNIALSRAARTSHQPAVHRGSDCRGDQPVPLRKDHNLYVVATVLPALSAAGRTHTNLNACYYIKLWRKFIWNISLYGNWDNQPPAFRPATTAPVAESPTNSASASHSSKYNPIYAAFALGFRRSGVNFPERLEIDGALQPAPRTPPKKSEKSIVLPTRREFVGRPPR